MIQKKAPFSGMFTPRVNNGDCVKSMQVIGTILFGDEFRQLANGSGEVLSMLRQQLVAAGDLICEIDDGSAKCIAVNEAFLSPRLPKRLSQRPKKKAAKKTVRKTPKKVAKKPIQSSSKKAAKKVIKSSSKERATKASKKTFKKPTKKAAKKIFKRSAKKVPKKRGRKKNK
jgi:hypothetical protein